MPRPLVIFGAGEQAEVALYYFRARQEVTCLTVDDEFLTQTSMQGVPVIAFSECLKQFKPSLFDMHVAIGYSGLNKNRETKCAEVMDWGYQLRSYIHGEFHGRHGFNCFVLEHNTVQPFVELGNNVVLWSGNHVGHHTKVGDNTFITSHVVISGGCRVGKNCFLGVNSTITDHKSIGNHCVVTAGALVNRNIPDGSVFTDEGLSRVPSSKVKL